MLTPDVTDKGIDMGGISSSAGTTATRQLPSYILPKLPRQLSQKKFAGYADWGDSFYNATNLESVDSSTTLVDTLGFDHPRCGQPKAHCNRDGGERNYGGPAGRLI